MSEDTNSSEEQSQSGSPSIGVYPTAQGIALEINDGTSGTTLVLSPDDASRIAVNLITNVVMMQMNNAMRAAAERAEVERMREIITNPQGKVHVPFVKK